MGCIQMSILWSSRGIFCLFCCYSEIKLCIIVLFTAFSIQTVMFPIRMLTWIFLERLPGCLIPPLLLPKLHYHLFSLANVLEEVIVMIPVRKLFYFFQTCLFIVITDQLLHSCVNSKLDDKVGPKSWYTVYLCTGHTTSLTSYFLLAQGSVSSQVLEFCDKLGRNYGDECWTEVNEQIHTYVMSLKYTYWK